MGALLVAAGVPMRQLGLRRRRSARCSCCSSRSSSPTGARGSRRSSNPWADAGGAGFQSVQGQIALGSGGLFGARARRVGAEDLLPARGPHRLHPRGHRRGARRGRDLRAAFLYGMIAYAGLRTAKAAQGRLREAARRRADVADPLPGDAEHLRGAGPRAADRRAAAVHLLGLVVADGAAAAMGLLLNVAAAAAHSGRAEPCDRRRSARWRTDGRDRSRRDSRPRRARAGGRRRAAG